MDFVKLLERAKSLSDIFEVVKSSVREALGMSRAGLMLGLADLGNHPQGFLGAFHPIASNVIVMNRVPLRRIEETNPELYKPYAYNILLHEYLHTLGHLDEMVVQSKTYEITVACFGEKHLATQIAADYSKFFPNLVYPDVAWMPEELKIELVGDFDRSSVGYIT